MKKILPAFVVLMLSLCLILSGCGQSKLATPQEWDQVLGNGGSCVTKGDFVYYVNGYESHNSFASTHENKLGEVEDSCIYKAELEDGKLVNKEVLVSKVAGFENASIYIFDDMLYFATTNVKKDAEGKVRSELLTFFKINLDGTELKEIYTTDTYSAGSFSFMGFDGVTLLVFDGEKIVKINTSNNDKEIIVEKATSALLPVDNTCDKYSELILQDNQLHV